MAERPSRRDVLKTGASALTAAVGIGILAGDASAEEILSESFPWVKIPAGVGFSLGLHGVRIVADRADQTVKFKFPDSREISLSRSSVLDPKDRVKEARFVVTGKAPGPFLELTIVRENGKHELYWIEGEGKNIADMRATYRHIRKD